MKNLHIFLIVLCGLFLFSCDNRTKIKDLLDNPAKYENKEITIAGVVTSSTNLPNVMQYYMLKDDSGEIMVYIKEDKNHVPNENAKVSATGKLIQNAKFFGIQRIYLQEMK